MEMFMGSGSNVPPGGRGKPLRKEQRDRLRVRGGGLPGIDQDRGLEEQAGNQCGQSGLMWAEYMRGLYLISNRGDIMRAIGERGTRAGYVLRHTDERGRVWVSENGQKMHINVWRIARSLF